MNPNLMDWAYATNLEELKSIETHCVVIYVHSDVATCFDSFGIEHIPKKIKKFVGSTVIKATVFSWYFSRCCKFCSRIKNFCNNCRN